jgi:hypothetical protein
MGLSYDVVFLLLDRICNLQADSFSVVSWIRDEVTNEPCIAENKEPPNTPATSMWTKCCVSAWNTTEVEST